MILNCEFLYDIFKVVLGDKILEIFKIVIIVIVYGMFMYSNNNKILVV